MKDIKKVVITGAAGFIGSNLAHYFDENLKDVVCYAGLPLLRPFTLGYAPFPRTVKGERT